MMSQCSLFFSLDCIREYFISVESVLIYEWSGTCCLSDNVYHFIESVVLCQSIVIMK